MMQTYSKALLASALGLFLVNGSVQASSQEERAKSLLSRHMGSLAVHIERVSQLTSTWIGGGEIGNDPDRPRRNPGTIPLDDWADGIDYSKVYNFPPGYNPDGVKARYCDNTLLVYLDDPAPKGIGPGKLRLIQTAKPDRHRKLNGSPDIQHYPLQWLMGDRVESTYQYVNPIIVVPDCMQNLPLPVGTPALITRVVDINTVTHVKPKREIRYDACPDGTHGVIASDGTVNNYMVRMMRTGTQHYNSIVGWIAEPQWGDWEETTDYCQDDSVYEFSFKSPCGLIDLGNGRTRQGYTWFKQERIRNQDGETMTAPVMKGSQCEDVQNGLVVATLPDPIVDEVNTTETGTQSCPSGYTGSISISRTKTVRTTSFVWRQDPITTTTYTNWAQISNSCVQSLACYQGQKGGQDQDNYYFIRTDVGQRAGNAYRVSMSDCGGGSSSSSGGDKDSGGTDFDGDGRDRQDGDTNDHEGPSNGDAENGDSSGG